MNKKFLAIIIFVFIFLSAAPAYAFPTLIPEECTGEALITDCNLTAVEQLIANAAQIILGISGSLALLFFVIGGIMYIASGGNPGKIQKATDILAKATLGLGIILLAGVAIKLVIKKLTGLE
ncbi:hypothetical protein KKC32_05340 [Patescibacteria group bacterium]|nr:hypothetical protein [Patescibacteria group bacterium]